MNFQLIMIIRFILFTAVGAFIGYGWSQIALVYGVYHGIAFLAVVIGAAFTLIYKLIEG